MRPRLVLLSTLFACAAAGAAPSAPAVDLKQTWRLNLAPRLAEGGWASLKLTLNARLWTLMGEPVVYCDATWSLGTVQLKTAAGGDRVFDHIRSNTPEAAWKGVALAQARFALPLDRHLGGGRVDTAWVVCDIGSAWPESDPRPSLNVAGSPAWNRLLLQRPPGLDGAAALQRAESWLPAAQAREFVADAGTRWRDSAHQLEPVVLELDAGPLRALDEQRLADEAARDLERRRQSAAGRPAAGSEPFAAMFDEVDERVAAPRAARQRERGEAAARERQQRADAQRRRIESARCAAAKDVAIGGAGFDASSAAALAIAQRCGGSLVAFQSSERGPWGYRSADGEVRVEPRWNAVLPFAEGRGGVHDGRSWRLVDREGRFVGDGRWSGLQAFSEGLAPARDGGRWGFVDTEGRWVVEPRFDELRPMADGVAPASERDGDRVAWGLVERDGRWRLAPRHDAIAAFSEGLAAFRERGAWGYLDAQGRVVVPARYQTAGAFADGRARVARRLHVGGSCDEYREDWEEREIDRQGRELRVLRNWSEHGQLCLSRMKR